MRSNAILSISIGAALLSGCASTDRQQTVTDIRREPPKTGILAAFETRETVTRERVSRARPASMGFGRVSSESRFASLQGPPKIEISLGSQQAYFYKGDELVTASPVSTGKPGFRTPKGSYRISQKKQFHRSNLYGQYVNSSGAVVDGDADARRDPRPRGAVFVGAMMPYFMRFNGGIGMHQGYVPGYPASHGCVRLPAQTAQLFFENAPVGTRVVVTE